MIMFARHLSEYLHTLKDWDVNHDVSFLVAALWECIPSLYLYHSDQRNVSSRILNETSD